MFYEAYYFFFYTSVFFFFFFRYDACLVSPCVFVFFFIFWEIDALNIKFVWVCESVPVPMCFPQCLGVCISLSLSLFCVFQAVDVCVIFFFFVCRHLPGNKTLLCSMKCRERLLLLPKIQPCPLTTSPAAHNNNNNNNPATSCILSIPPSLPPPPPPPSKRS